MMTTRTTTTSTSTKQQLPKTVSTYCTSAAHSSREDENPNVIHSIENVPQSCPCSLHGRIVELCCPFFTRLCFLHQALPTSVTQRLHRPGLGSCNIELSSPDGGEDTLHTTTILWYPLQSVAASDIVTVNPARNPDASGQLGTESLRKSKSPLCPERTFSIAVSRAHHQSEWSQAPPPGHFRYIDLEADTIELCWLVFRGILLLHRDAFVGRFAKHRAAGMGGGHYLTH